VHESKCIECGNNTLRRGEQVLIFGIIISLYMYSIKAYSTQEYDELILLWNHKKIFQDKFVEWDKPKKDPNTPLDVIQGAKRMEIQQIKFRP
jgi:hypothetical protein